MYEPTLERTYDGFIYREACDMVLNDAQKVNLLFRLPIQVSSLGLEIGEGPNTFISWEELEKIRHNLPKKRNIVSSLFLRLARWFDTARV